jgi:hypothetical protein
MEPLDRRRARQPAPDRILTADGQSAAFLGTPIDEHPTRRLRIERPPGLIGMGSRMELSIPADHLHVRVARLTATGLGSLFGLNVNALDELRLVVGEACSVLLDCAAPSDDQPDRLAVTFRHTDTAIRIRVERPHADVVATPSEISEAILDTLCERWCLMSGPVMMAEVSLGD